MLLGRHPVIAWKVACGVTGGCISFRRKTIWNITCEKTCKHHQSDKWVICHLPCMGCASKWMCVCVRHCRMAIPGYSDYTGKWALQHTLPPCCISQLADFHEKTCGNPMTHRLHSGKSIPNIATPQQPHHTILGRKENHPVFFPWWIVAMDLN